jgi:hypothetical protein
MLKITSKIYFYGEFGCLNYCILGHLEELQPYFSIFTQPDYFKLMKMKSPMIDSAIEELKYVKNCKGSGFGASAFGFEDYHINKLIKDGFISLKNFLKLDNIRCIHHLKPIRQPLIQEIGLKEKYISVSFRNRDHEKYRNLDKKNWFDVLEYIKSISDLKIIAHGMDLDTLDASVFNVYKVNTIEESIAYMNKSKVFIGSMSGIAQFASNCACPIVQIGDISRHFHYDPFDKGCVATTMEDFKTVILDFLK